MEKPDTNNQQSEMGKLERQYLRSRRSVQSDFKVRIDMKQLIKLFAFLCILGANADAHANDCDEYNHPNGLPEGFVSDLSCSRHHQYYRRPVADLLDAVLKKKPTNGNFPVLVKCPFEVFGATVVRINSLASIWNYESDSKIFQSKLVLTGGDLETGFEENSVDIDYPDRVIFNLYLYEFIDVNDPYVVWCYRTEAGWKNRKNTDKSGPDLKKIFIPYEATYCILEKNLDKRPKDRRLVKFWCI